MNKFTERMTALTPLTLFGQRPMKGDVGLEHELEGTGTFPAPVKGWEAHQDNSLRGPGGVGHGGMEYTTRGAVAERDVIPAVETLQTALEKAGVILRQDAHRSSTHIHVNVQNVKMLHVFGYLTIFTCIEPMMLALCGDRRDGNSFCASSFETGDLAEFFNVCFKSMERYGNLGDGQRGKYASLSTFRLHDLGTLEARIFPQTVDPQLVDQWVRWLLNIRSIACTEDDQTYRRIVKEGLHEPLTLARRVFYPNGGYIPMSDNLQRELVEFGSQEAYELTRLMKRYITKEDVKPKEPKKPDEFMEIEMDTVGLDNFGGILARANVGNHRWRLDTPAVGPANPPRRRAE